MQMENQWAKFHPFCTVGVALELVALQRQLL